MFKRSITYLRKNDSDLGDQVVGFGKQHEFADVLWYPSQHKAVYRMDDRVSSNTSGNGFFDFIPFRATSSLELAIVRTTGLASLITLISSVQANCISKNEDRSCMKDESIVN